MSGKGYWNLATDSNKSEGLRKLEGPRHVRAYFLEFG
jgi:hypothetical protein